MPHADFKTNRKKNGRSVELLDPQNDDTLYSNVDITSNSSRDSIVPTQFGVSTGSTSASKAASDEYDFLNECKNAAMVHILGNTIVRARRDSYALKKISVDYIYAFLGGFAGRIV